ncbi:MAG: helix-turn-helix domain-containing protein [Pyrinomonadaceae bacterium]
MAGLITQSEAAALRGVSLSSINNLVRRGRLRSVEQFGKRLVYRADVLAYVPDKGGRPPKPTTETTRQLNSVFRKATESGKKASKKGKR